MVAYVGYKAVLTPERSIGATYSVQAQAGGGRGKGSYLNSGFTSTVIIF